MAGPLKCQAACWSAVILNRAAVGAHVAFRLDVEQLVAASALAHHVAHLGRELELPQAFVCVALWALKPRLAYRSNGHPFVATLKAKSPSPPRPRSWSHQAHQRPTNGSWNN